MSKPKKSRINRKKSIKRANTFKVVSISQKVKIKRNNLEISNVKPLEEDQKEENEFFSIDTLSQTHLEILMNNVREKNWTHIHERSLATLIYMVLKLEGLNRNKIGTILSKIGTFCDRTAHRYTSRFLNGDEEAIFEENRGKYHRDTIFEMLPDFTEDIKQYTIEKVSQKEATFNINDLMRFSKALLLQYDPLLNPDQFITEKNLNVLISSWGFFWGKNKARPYINGHEREDVVKKRETFVKYFMDSKDTHHIYVKREYESMNSNLKQAAKEYNWSYPFDLSNYRILIAHDESTFRYFMGY
jgi:hypothetical protein